MVGKKKLVFGVGINDADYDISKAELIEGRFRQVWLCPFYRKWTDMLRRSYSDKAKEKWQCYKDVTTCEEWLTFSNFKSWMEQQDWEGRHLDKDILFPGNKVYSPEKCVFVCEVVNLFITDRRANRGEFPTGVHKYCGKYQVRCSNPFTQKREYLGLFDVPEEAHAVWLKRKQELAVELAAIQTDERVAKALIDRYFNYTEEAL